MTEANKAAAGAVVGRFLHLGARGAHDPGTSGPPRRGLRPQPLLHRALLPLRPKIPPLPGIAGHPAGYLAFVEKLLRLARHSMCCCRATSRDFCSRAWRSGCKRASAWRCRVSKTIAPRTARPASAGCSAIWACRSRRRSIVTSEQQLRGAMRLPTVIKTSVGTASRGVWFVRNADDLENALTRACRRRRFCRRGAGAGIHCRVRPRRRSRCSAMAD